VTPVFWQKFLLTMAAIGSGVLSAVLPASAYVTSPIAVGLLTWAHLPRPGDVRLTDAVDIVEKKILSEHPPK